MRDRDQGSDLVYLLKVSAVDLDSLRFTERHNLVARRSLKRLRRSRDLAQADLAAMLGVSQTTLAGYETGERQMPVSIFLTTVRFAGVTIEAALREPTGDERKRELARVQRLRRQLPKGSPASARVDRLIRELKVPSTALTRIH